MMGGAALSWLSSVRSSIIVGAATTLHYRQRRRH